MFQLIVTIISIALIVALALASIFYGGTAFTNSAAKTAEAALVNGGQQIAAAEVLYQNDNAGASSSSSSFADLAPVYLQATPSLPTGVTGAWAQTTAHDFADVKIDVAGNIATNATCVRVLHDNGGVSGTSTGAGAVVSGLGAAQFGCVADSTGVFFAYKI